MPDKEQPSELRPLEEFPEFHRALVAGVAWDKFIERERPATGFERYAYDTSTHEGRCPCCGTWPAEATMTENGVSYYCPKKCTVAEIRAAIERTTYRHQLADLVLEQEPREVLRASMLRSLCEFGKARVNQRDPS